MQQQHPKLRDQRKLHANEPYALNSIPDDIVYVIGESFVYLLYTGRKDLGGNDWGDVFAEAVGGQHLGSPVGIADVIKNRMAWSMKTVKNTDPFSATSVRLISGRCSPDYSFGISDPHEDVQKTGCAVLEIWNERVNIAKEEYAHVRSCILVRSDDMTKFSLFEDVCDRYRTADYTWEANKNGNLIGRRKSDGEICFTWQPHGSQFTIHAKVPADAVKFTIKRPPELQKEEVIRLIGFDRTWVEISR